MIKPEQTLTKNIVIINIVDLDTLTEYEADLNSAYTDIDLESGVLPPK
jgi:hypothetical protein